MVADKYFLTRADRYIFFTIVYAKGLYSKMVGKSLSASKLWPSLNVVSQTLLRSWPDELSSYLDQLPAHGRPTFRTSHALFETQAAVICYLCYPLELLWT